MLLLVQKFIGFYPIARDHVTISNLEYLTLQTQIACCKQLFNIVNRLIYYVRNSHAPLIWLEQYILI